MELPLILALLFIAVVGAFHLMTTGAQQLLRML